MAGSSTASGPILRIASDARSSAAWAASLTAQLSAAAADPGVSVIVVAIPATGGSPDSAHFEQLCEAIARSHRPVVIELAGRQGGWGVSLCSCADLVVASDDALFECEGDSSPTAEAIWPNYLPIRVAKWLAYSAGPLTAGAAVHAGFVNRVVPSARLREETQAFAERIARVPGDLLAVKKEAHAFSTRVS